jgi:hypothetical protein
MAQRRTSPRRSGGSESAVKNRSTSPGPRLKKAKNDRGSIFNRLIFIEVFRVLSKHTTYVSMRPYKTRIAERSGGSVSSHTLPGQDRGRIKKAISSNQGKKDERNTFMTKRLVKIR